MSPLSLVLLIVALQCLFLGSLSQLTFPESYITIPRGDLKFYFDFDEARSVVRMGLEANKNLDYFAVGFANPEHYGMDNFDIVAFTFPNNNDAPQVLDLYSSEFGQPPTDVSLGGTADYRLLNSYVADGKRQVLFERAFNTGDRFDLVLDPQVTKGGQVMNWAFSNAGEKGVSYHEQNAGTIISPLYNGFIGVATEYLPSGEQETSLLAVHGWVMLVGWGLLVEIAIQIGRYRKHDKYFIAAHVILNTILYVATIVAIILVLVVKWGAITGTLPIVHFWVGILMVILATSQIVIGSILRNHIIRPQETNKIRLFNRIHLATGATLYFVSKFQLGVGVLIYRPSFMGYIYFYYIIVFALRIIQEYSYMIWDRLGGPKSLKHIEGANSKAPLHKKLMSLLNDSTPVHEIQQHPDLKDLKWAMLDNKVFETTGFNHPGGNYILKYIQGREIGRFSYGAYPLELYPESGQHQHSSDALLIMQKHLIGTVMHGQRVLNFHGGEEEQVKLVREGGDTMGASLLAPDRLIPDTTRWTLCRKTKLTSCISKFEFNSRGYSINTVTEDIRHIGRCMKVSHNSIRKTRQYTVLLCQSEPRIKRRESLWDNRNNPSAISHPGTDYHSDTIPLVIKRYDNPDRQTFSSFVHDSPTSSEGFIIEGPFGPGLGLTPESTGTHYVFAAGTGIWPFLDLFDFLLEELLDPNHNRKIFKNGFKVHVFASFGNIDDFVGLDICEKLIQACKDNKLEGSFKLTIKARGVNKSELYDIVDQNFDDDFIRQNVDTACKLVWVCGSPKFNYEVPTALGKIGLHDKVCLV